ncbi:MAG: LemA family protein [Candidatus Abyssobacteria bacterium SURF_17]|uniref:LemA family protein n=1 Tax=Candidatus Abyssobacteria bacterium SURF_17 TaxID=2093361 RepID=A0A419EVB4_9BACT|nr:MAG: LemA family protein [Candidatus Abyssubacteria bacterium SURF_17]
MIAIIIVVGVVLYVVYAYNRLITLRNRIKNAWAQIDVQLKRRYDLIPNLVETVKGYAKHEREVFEKVTDARTRAIGASGVREQGKAENQLSGALKTLFAVAENYPELKANQNFLLLQEELAGTEGKIAYARQFYNDNVMQYNITREKVPANIIAGAFGFGPQEMFEIEVAAEREPVKVKFD